LKSIIGRIIPNALWFALMKGANSRRKKLVCHCRQNLGMWLRTYPNNWYSKSMSDEKGQKRKRTPNNKTTTGFQVSDELWAIMQPILPEHINTHRFGGGRPRVPDRKCADGIFYVLRTGCQWKALDQTDLCSGSTAHTRYQEWVKAGIFLKLWQVGVEQFDELKGIDWEWQSMDGAMTKAPLGGGKNRAEPNGSG
jgi:putative transposase